jgi:uncharacterized protein (UPF0264 family)
MAQLLVSVRTAAEVEAALAGGAALLDVKEPANGPLGRADDGTVAEVVRAVAGRCPVSAALGELRYGMPARPVEGLRRCAYWKAGLAQFARQDWRGSLEYAIRQCEQVAPEGQVVTVAYADWQSADAPPVEEVCAFARGRPGSVFLLDTFTKAAGTTLLDYLPRPKIALLGRLCRAAGVRVALAGSLGREQIECLLRVEPDWFAVRGAVCAGGERTARVEEGKVRELVGLLGGRAGATRRAS